MSAHLHASARQETLFCQRWRARRESYRPGGEPIDSSAYGVELLTRSEAKRFVCEHHYSGTFPYAVSSFGLYHRRSPHQMPALAGVATFSVPISSSAAGRYANCQTSEAIELGRFVLLDDVPANGETWFLARAIAALVLSVLACASSSRIRIRCGGRPWMEPSCFPATSARSIRRRRPITPAAAVLDRSGWIPLAAASPSGPSARSGSRKRDANARNAS